MQSLSDMQFTACRPPELGVNAAGAFSSDQALPFQVSAPAGDPSARQKLADVHEIADRKPEPWFGGALH
jgi:hypothetical protein